MTDTRLTSSATGADGASPVLAVQNLSVSFRGRSGENQALKGINGYLAHAWTPEQREWHSIAGASLARQSCSAPCAGLPAGKSGRRWLVKGQGFPDNARSTK